MIPPIKRNLCCVLSLRIASATLLTLAVACSIICGCTSGSSVGKGSGTTPPIVSFTTSSIQATVGTAITPVTPTVTGTVTGFTISPALPAGLALNASTGTISGTPTQTNASATYVLTATNSAGSGTASIQISVALVAPSNLAYPQPSISAIVGTAITPDTPSVTGTVASYTISPALPAGISISATTGTISGTPTVASPSTAYTVTATNATGSATATVQIAVLIPAPSGLAYPQPSITAPVGTAITPDTPTVTSTVTSYTISPALPAGLTINAATGTISGTPTAGSPSTAYTVTASNGTGSTTAVVQITVNGSGAPTNLNYAPSSLIPFIGTAITPITPTVIGTVTGYTVSPPLPGGLTINATTGVLSGTPTDLGPGYNYTVTASNQSGSTTTNLHILVNPPLLAFKYPQTSIQAVVGTPIVPETPVVTYGTATSYEISGTPLPSGIVIDGQTGTISGTPTAASALKTYTIYANGPSGARSSALLQITVTPPSPVSITYPQTWITATVGTAIAPDLPTITGELTTFTINPALPAGLSIDPSTGIISGTPTASVHTTAYTVTASGSGGTATATVSITAGTVRSLLDLGTTTPARLAISGDRVLAADTGILGKWVLWDYPAGNVVAEGTTNSFFSRLQGAAIAGNLALIPDDPPHIISSVDGSFLFDLSDVNVGFSWYQLAPDGSYVCAGGANGMDVFSAGGAIEFTLPGDYSNAKIYASPTQLQIANGPYGNNLIETVQVSGGAISLGSTFNGTFLNWFGDGQRFLTNQGSVVWIYSNATALQDTYILSFITAPNLVGAGGYGNWFWVANNGQGQLFQLGNTTPQLTSFLPATVNGPIVAAYINTSPQVTVYDLSGSSLISSVTALPSVEGNPQTFAGRTSTQWVVANQYGVVIDGATASTTPHTFNYGKVLDLAGSSTYAAVRTAVGQTFIYDASGTQVNATSFAPASFVISQNGSTLGSLDSKANGYFYSLPSMNLIASPSETFPYINFSANGQYAGVVTGSYLSPSGELIGLPGPTYTIPVTKTVEKIYPSPDGSLVAVPVQPDGVPDQNSSATLYHSNASLVAAVSGNPEGWIDSDSLLVATFKTTLDPNIPYYYYCSVIYDASGNLKFSFPQNTLPQLSHPQFINANEVYQDGTIYLLTTGAIEWKWPGLQSVPGFSNTAVLGSNVIFATSGDVNLISR